MLKNTAGQKWRVFAFNRTTNAPALGDAANITAKISKDWGATAALADTNPTETEDGYYLFDIAQAECDANNLDIFPESSTANIQVIGTPASQITTVDMSNVVLIDDINAALAAIDALLSPELAQIKTQTDLIPAAPASETTSAAIKAKTDNLPVDPADQSILAGFLTDIVSWLDTEIAAIKLKTDALPASPANEVSLAAVKVKTDLLPAAPANEVTSAAIQVLAAAIKVKTDNLPIDPASETTLTSIITFLSDIIAFIDPELAAIKLKTDALPLAPANEATSAAIAVLVAAVKAKTDLLPAAPANEATSVAIKAKTDLIPAGGIAEQVTVALMSKLLFADKFIDTTTDPWEVVYLESGTANELLRQPLRSVAGAPIITTDVVIAQVGL